MKQGEFIYVKVLKILPLWGKWKHCPKVVVSGEFPFDAEEMYYNDRLPNTRIIGASKVEKAIEVSEYIAKCCVAGYAVIFEGGRWGVFNRRTGAAVTDSSIRKAYYLMKQKEGE